MSLFSSVKTQLSLSLSLGLSVLVLSSCSVNSESKQEKLGYNFTQNNCPTGAHEFSSRDAYCEGLRDEALNRNCAYALRKAAFESNSCKGSFDGAKTASEPIPRSTPIVRRGVEPVPAPGSSRPVIDTSKPISLFMKPVQKLAVEAKTSGDKMMTFLNGELQLAHASSAVPKTLFFVRAEAVKISPDLGACQLQIQQYTSLSEGSTMKFSLVGVEPAEGAAAGCLGKLGTMALSGFTVEFHNVPVSQLSDEVVPTVLLNVGQE